MATPSTSRETTPPVTSPSNITPAAATHQPNESIQCYSPTSPAYESTNISMDDLDYEPEKPQHATPERQSHSKPTTDPVFSPENDSVEMHSSSDEEENDPAETHAELLKELGEKKFKKMAKLFQNKPKEFDYQFKKYERKHRERSIPASNYEGELSRENR